MGLIFYFAFVKFPMLKVAKMARAAMLKDIRPMSRLLDRVAIVLIIVFLGLITLRIFRVIGDEWMPWIFGVFFISIGILGLIQCIRAKNSLKTSPEFAAVYRTTFFIMWFAIIGSILIFIEATVDIPNGVILLFFSGIIRIFYTHLDAGDFGLGGDPEDVERQMNKQNHKLSAMRGPQEFSGKWVFKKSDG